MKIILIITSLFIITGAAVVLFQKSLKKAAIIMGIVSLLTAFVFVLMKAYDVAITEASIGAVLTTAIYFIGIKRLENSGYKEKKK